MMAVASSATRGPSQRRSMASRDKLLLRGLGYFFFGGGTAALGVAREAASAAAAAAAVSALEGAAGAAAAAELPDSCATAGASMPSGLRSHLSTRPEPVVS